MRLEKGQDDGQDGIRINQNETTNTGYEMKNLAVDLERKTKEIISDVREIKKEINKASQIRKEIKVSKPIEIGPSRIKTGKYINEERKRTFTNALKGKTGSTFRRGERINTANTDNTGMEVYRLQNQVRNNVHNIAVAKNKIKNLKTTKIRTRIMKKNYANKATLRKSTKAVKAVSNVATKIAQAVVVKLQTAVGSVITAVVGQSSMIVLVALIPLIAIAAIIGSICGGVGGTGYMYILADEEVIVDYYKEVERLNNEVNERIQKMADDATNGGKYEAAIIETSSVNINFQEIMAIIGTDKEQDYEKFFSKISDVHSKFYNIRTKETKTTIRESYEVTVTDMDTGGTKTKTEYRDVTKYTLHIYADQYNFAKVANKYFGNNEEKLEWANNLASSNVLELYPDLAGMGVVLVQGSLTQSEIQNILSKLPSTDVTRENVVALAENLIGKITYGWGSKWKEGDPAPTSLDCSGFVDYVYQMLGAGKVSAGGGGTYAQWDNSYAIHESEIQIGDLGFLKPPSQSSDNSPNHVGIFVGYDNDGNMMFVHCQGSTGVVKTTVDAAGFEYFRRVKMNYAPSPTPEPTETESDEEGE